MDVQFDEGNEYTRSRAPVTPRDAEKRKLLMYVVLAISAIAVVGSFAMIANSTKELPEDFNPATAYPR
ncbi:MAG TPA: hypothetical protein VF696_02450 [Candidatus Paceibacterota bacterium]|jgi:hypothetical protein